MKNGKFRVLFLYPNLMAQTKFPMGIAILSSILRQNGYEVAGFDTTFYRTDEKAPHEYQIEKLQLRPLSEGFEDALNQQLHPYESMVPDFRAKVEAFQPDLIAVSAVEDTFSQAVLLLEGVRDLEIPNIVGGVFPTFAPEKAMRHRVVDTICLGEGEGPLLDYCNALSQGKDPSRIPNLWVRKANGEISKSTMRRTINLDDLPQPDFDLFDNKGFYFTTKAQSKMLRSGSVETARGCPYTCSFCNSPSQVRIYNEANAGSFFRLKSVDNVYRELKYLKEILGAEYIYFPADTFLAVPDAYLKRLAEMYEDIALPFWCQTRPETLTPERVAILDKMGCQNVSIGLEHGNQVFRRDVVQRNYSNEEFLERIQVAETTSDRMQFTINVIVGLPTETRELTWDTINLVRPIHHLINQINAFNFTPYHGTPLRKVALEKGYIEDEQKLHHNYKDTILNMPQYTADEIRGATRTFTMYVRLPDSAYPKIRVAEGMTAEGDRIFRELREEYEAEIYRLPSAAADPPNLGFSVQPS